MKSLRRIPLLLVLAVALVATGVTTTLIKTSNPSSLSNGLNSTSEVESSALFCTGLSSSAGGFAGHVTYLNTSASTRTVVVKVVADTGHSATTTLTLKPYASQTVNPAQLTTGNSYGVAAEIDGSGVVAEEVAASSTAEVPCQPSGVTRWYAAGFDTLVGSNAYVSLYNPTATPAVLNLVTYSPHGFNAPAPFQGLSVGAHAQVEVKLGSEIVDATNIGVGVKVLRGSIVAVGVQSSGAVASLNQGSTTTATTMWFPSVTTVANALAELRIANPGPVAATITATIAMPPYKVSPQSVTIPPYASGTLTITPNSAIPPAGYASVTLRSTARVFSSLATGTSSGLALDSPGVPQDNYLLADFSGRGFDAATVTNTATTSIKVRFTLVGGHGATATAPLAAHTTESILHLFNGVTSLRGASVEVTASASSLLVSATLPSTPVGVTVISPLDGR